MTIPSLKLPELDVNPADPWADDALQRNSIAEALTNLLREEGNPCVISLNGSWGTGKTFLLKRWQAQLEKNGFKAIYFNAWEDDYCGDPLVALIGQLWDALKEPDFKEIGKAVKDAAKPLLTNTVFNMVRTLTVGTVDLSADALKSVAECAVGDYISQRVNKDELRKRLNEMATRVYDETAHPLVFIIDELDRCRPPFAIEMLERLKHIFNIPNMVFVIGVDRDQLRSSIRSVYGEIDVDGYLRRFFDMEFILPPADSTMFCKHLLTRHGLSEYSQKRTRDANNIIHSEEYSAFSKEFPVLCARLGISLRDIEHCIRSLIFTIKNVSDNFQMYPNLLAVLLLLRLKNIGLYMEFISGQCCPAKVLDYIEGFFNDEELSTKVKLLLKKLQITLYLTGTSDSRGRDPVGQQLQLMEEGKDLTAPEHLSGMTKRMSREESEKFYADLVRWRGARMSQGHPEKASLGYLSEKIELATLMVKADGE